jgi:hypothetical protein
VADHPRGSGCVRTDRDEREREVGRAIAVAGGGVPGAREQTRAFLRQIRETVDDPLTVTEGVVEVVARQSARFGPIGMEQLWNRGGATGGKRSALWQR